MRFGGRDLGVDLGTANSLIFVARRGIILREPSVIAMDKETGKVLAVGREARRMLGRTSGHVVAVRPLRRGVIAHFDLTEIMLRRFLQRIGRRMVLRPRVVVCVPSGVTSVERRAVIDVVMQAGARQVFVIEEPVAAALGARLDINQPSGTMVVDIGGGTTDIAVLSFGGVVLSESLRTGGDALDEAISRYVRQECNLLIGERSAEELKWNIGSAIPTEASGSWEVRGRDMTTGLPRNVQLNAAQISEAFQEPLTDILQGVQSVLERTPPELSADIVEKGIVLTGGGALLRNIDRLLAQHTGVPVQVAEDPLSCVVLGTGKALESLDRQVLLSS